MWRTKVYSHTQMGILEHVLPLVAHVARWQDLKIPQKSAFVATSAIIEPAGRVHIITTSCGFMHTCGILRLANHEAERAGSTA